MAEQTWFYHLTYQYPIANAVGHPVGYAYGDTTIRTAGRITNDEEMGLLREGITDLADRGHRNDADGVRRAGKPVLMSITLLASPEEAS